MDEKIIELDLEQLHLTEQGIEDYYWPVSLAETKCLRALTREALSLALIEARDLDQGATILLEVTSLGILNTVMRMVQATLLMTRCQQVNYFPRVNKHYPFLSALATGSVDLLDTDFVNLLRRGPVSLSLLKLPFRWARDLLKGCTEGIPRRRLCGPCLSKEVISLRTDALVQRWQEKCMEKATFLRANYWFRPVKKLSVLLNVDEKALVNQLVHRAKAIFRSFELDCPSIFHRYLHSFISQSFLYSKQHLQCLCATNKIPLKLWGNTGGSVWMRLLSAVVRQQGGHVTGFDHAGGSAYFQERDDYYLRELLVCDHFVTFSEKQAAILREDCQNNTALLPHKPTLSCISTKPVETCGLVQKITGPTLKQSVKTILYVSTIYPGERVGTNADFMSDLTLLDWQIRLCAQLKKRGYRILLRPHPESLAQPPVKLERFLGSVIQRGVFPSALKAADVLLFDTLASTTFMSAVKSGKPMVLVQFGLAELPSSVTALLSRRCSIVKGCFDVENRANVDWEALAQALLDAEAKRDPSFENEYYCT